ncbi:MAG: glycosyltransferase [Candidatus Heimdallarchaeota archaeon]|nr:glycosyltransferase [Candidatus Heimdallarchaeota archaeon]
MIFLIVAFVPFVPIFSYFLSLTISNLFIYFRKIIIKKPLYSETSFSDIQFKPITFVIPTHNEEKVIRSKLMSIMNIEFPARIEVIVVDDSTDSTPKIIEEIQIENKNIKLIHSEERMGYNRAIILGIENSKTEFVVLTDSHSIIGNTSIKSAIKILSENQKVGSISGSCRLLNPENRSSKIEALYQGFLDFIRKAETNISSTFFVKGEIVIARRNPISDLKDINGCYDNESSLWLIKKGSKVLYSKEVYYFEHFPTKVKERFEQKKIRALNLLRTIWKFKSLLFNPQQVFIGFFLYPFYFYFSFIFPVLIIFSAFSFSIFLILLAIRINNIILYILIPSVILILLLIPFIRNNIYGYIQIELSLLYANYLILFKSQKEITKIPRIESTRVT